MAASKQAFRTDTMSVPSIGSVVDSFVYVLSSHGALGAIAEMPVAPLKAVKLVREDPNVEDTVVCR